MIKNKIRKQILYVLLVLALLGLVVSSYQAIEHYFLTSSVCDFTESFSCSIVTESYYGEFPFNSGIAVSLYGIIWWAVLVGLIGYMLNKKIKDLEYYAFLWNIIGLGTIVYLLIVELYLLPKEIGQVVICPLCTLQHVLIIILFFCTYLLLKKPLIKYRLNPRPVFIIAVIALIAVGGYFILSEQTGEIQYDQFTKCLGSKNATMYGFNACPNCNKQKHILGIEAFKQNIDETGHYIRCRPESEALTEIGDRLETISILSSVKDQVTPNTTQGDLCVLMVAQGTPTWIINDQQVSGWQTISELADLSGCQILEGVELD